MDEGRYGGLVLEANGPGDNLNDYVLPLLVLLVKGEEVELGPIYLGSYVYVPG